MRKIVHCTAFFPLLCDPATKKNGNKVATKVKKLILSLALGKPQKKKFFFKRSEVTFFPFFSLWLIR